MAPPPSPRPSMRLPVFVAGATILVTETALFHLLRFTHDYLQATLVIAYALLGLAVGSIASARWPVFGPRLVRGLMVALPLSIGAAFVQVVRLPEHVFLSPVLMAPFTIGGALVTAGFRMSEARHVYAFDLAGAMIGLLGAVIAIPTLRVEGTFFAAIATIALVTAVAHHRHRISFGIAGATYLAAIAALGVSQGSHRLDLEAITVCYDASYPRKSFCGRDHVLALDNLVARISVHRSRFRNGKSMFLIDYDGHNNDRVTRDGPRLWRSDIRVPFGFEDEDGYHRLLPAEGPLLAIGAGAQGIIKPLRNLVDRPSSLIGVELNPAIVELMTGPLFEASGRAYEGMDVHVIDARSWLASTSTRYRLITLLNTYRTGNIGHVGEPDFLHTREAFVAYLEHLTDDGYLLIEERDVHPLAQVGTMRVMRNLRAALRQVGAKVPRDHFFVYRYNVDARRKQINSYTMMAVRRTPLPAEDVAHFERFLAMRRAREEGPNAVPTRTDLDHLPGHPTRTIYGRFFRAPDPGVVMAATVPGLVVDTSVTTDDRPFVFAVLGLDEETEQVLWAVVRTCLPLLLIAWALLHRAAGPGRRLRAHLFGLYFLLLGLAYLVVEVVLMRLYQNLMGSPTYAMVFVLGALVGSSALGGWVHGDRGGGVAFLAIGATAAYHILLGRQVVASMGLGPLGSSCVVALTIVPLGWTMGVPFPLAMDRAKRTLGTDAGTWLFAINSVAGTFTVVATMAMSMVLGFERTIGVGLVGYGLAGGLWWLSLRHEAA